METMTTPKTDNGVREVAEQTEEASRQELYAAILAGLDDVKAGRVMDINEAMADIRRRARLV